MKGSMVILRVLFINLCFFIVFISISSLVAYFALPTPTPTPTPTKGISPPIYKKFNKIKIKEVKFAPDKENISRFSREDQIRGLSAFPPGYRESFLKKPGVFNSIVRIKNSESIVYSVQYVLNEFGIRRVENQVLKAKQTFVAAFGCSNTFGEGLVQGQDYPSQLAEKLSSKYFVYNFGFHGFSPSNFIKYLTEDQDVYKKVIKGDSGYFVWLFLPAHMMRYFCFFDCYYPKNRWILNSPEIIKNENGKYLVKNTKFADSKVLWRRILFSTGDKIPLTLRRFTYKYDQIDFNLFSEAIEYLSQNITFSRQLKKKIFVLREVPNESFEEKLRISLRNEGFLVVDLRNLFERFDIATVTIPGDGHPNEFANYLVSEAISIVIKMNENNRLEELKDPDGWIYF